MFDLVFVIFTIFSEVDTAHKFQMYRWLFASQDFSYSYDFAVSAYIEIILQTSKMSYIITDLRRVGTANRSLYYLELSYY